MMRLTIRLFHKTYVFYCTTRDGQLITMTRMLEDEVCDIIRSLLSLQWVFVLKGERDTPQD